jgi:hypothetical protein
MATLSTNPQALPSASRSRSSSAAAQLAALARLEPLLETLTGEYQAMLAELENYREALTQADQPRLAAAAAASQARAVRLAELDAERAEIVRLVTPARQSAVEPTSSQLAALAPEPLRGRLLTLADRLRPIMDEAERRQRVVRLATQSLLAHTTAVMQQIHRQLSQTGVYTRSSRVPVAAGGPVVSSLDLTT